MSVAQGFGGMHWVGSDLHLDPALPDQWTALEFHLRFRGALLRVQVEPTRTEVLHLSGEAGELKLYGTKLKLSRRQCRTDRTPMKKSFILLLSLVSLVYSCQPIGLRNSAIQGLASTIQLQTGVTEVHLSDYFVSASWDSLRWPAGITAETIDSSTVLLSGQPEEFVSSVAVYFGPIRYDIPVCAASTQTVQWTIEGMEQAGSVHLFGSFNAWNREALQLERSAAGWKVELELKAGQYEYKLMVDGKEKTDPSNVDSVSNGMGGFNSVLRVEESGEPPVQVRALTHGKNFISLNAIPDDQELLVLWENHLLNTRKSFEEGQVVHNIPIPEPAFSHRAQSYSCILLEE